MDSIVIIGGGLAAANAVETLRDEGFILVRQPGAPPAEEG